MWGGKIFDTTEIQDKTYARKKQKLFNCKEQIEPLDFQKHNNYRFYICLIIIFLKRQSTIYPNIVLQIIYILNEGYRKANFSL